MVKSDAVLEYQPGRRFRINGLDQFDEAARTDFHKADFDPLRCDMVHVSDTAGDRPIGLDCFDEAFYHAAGVMKSQHLPASSVKSGRAGNTAPPADGAFPCPVPVLDMGPHFPERAEAFVRFDFR
jgi:hypothetical protein